MCAKRISKYDLTDDAKSYLIDLLNQTNKIVKDYQYNACDFSFTDITYVKNINDLTTAVCEGLDSLLSMQKHKIKEQTKLRSGTKNYYKKYYQNGNIKKIDCYVDGNHDFSFMAYYENNKRYLIPFKPETNQHSYTYTVVSVYDGNNVIEEYLVIETQIVYFRYDKTADGSIKRTYINYAPNGSYPILGCEIGIFEITEQIEYKPISEYSWYSEFDAKRKNAEFSAPDIPIIKTYI